MRPRPSASEVGKYGFYFYLFNLFLCVPITVCVQYYFVLFQVCSIVVRQSYTLQSCPPIFPVPAGTTHSYYNITDYVPYAVLPSPWLFCSCQSVLLNPFTFFTQSSNTPLPSGNHHSVLCICESVSVLFIYIVLQISHVSEIIWYLSDIFLLAQDHPGPSMLLQMIRFYSLLWLSNISLCICTAAVLSTHTLVALGLFPCLG